jgi:hypothetical protein
MFYKHSIVEILATYLSILQGFVMMAGYADADDEEQSQGGHW